VKATEELVKLQQQQQIMQQQEHDERILNMDLDKVAPWARQYYLKQQQQIMARAMHEQP